VGGVEAALESFEYAPGAFLVESDKGPTSPAGDDRGKYRADDDEGDKVAGRRLEAERASAREVTFLTNVMDPAPGTVVTFLDHPKSELGPGSKLLVVESSFQGEHPGLFRHACTAVSASAPYRPAVTTPKPRVQGVESATVVGPAGQEIHVDELGRVRVHFHWDRESNMDERSSCWIPTSQPWSGAGFGGTNLPRVGQEVIVDFLSGDPDRPVITGRVYTNQQKTPYALPANKTQSGWKSCSTQQTGGYNEIMFEDAAGRELVRMQAEKDLDKLVKNDERVVVGHDRTKLVKNDDSLTVNRDRTKVVDRDEDTTIGHDRRKLVKNDDDFTVGGNRQKRVQKNEREMVALSRTRMVGLNESVAVGVNQSVKVGTNQNVSVGKSQKVKVKKTATETIGVMKALTVGAAYQVSVGAVMNTTVGMSQSEQVGMTKKVNVGDKIDVVCGKASLSMEKAGRITWAIEGGASIVLEDKNIFITAGDGGLVVLKGGPEVHVNP
jgi:type VI secretion system secreted protein VgrG